MNVGLLIYSLASVSLVLCHPLTYPGGDSDGDAGSHVYRAAVYEHAVHIPWECLIIPVPRPVAVWNMMKNLNVYQEQTALAAKQGAKIIVFPEDGIYGMVFNRDTIKPFLEDIPDPAKESWNPCLLPKNFTHIDVQRKLSCMARENNIYVVANMGDRKSCTRATDPKCPDDGQYQYNTDVVFSSEGKLVARYHKRHLFKEGQFDKPDLEVVTFDTPFGRFGLFTCFDILFYRPAVEIVKNKKTKNLLFPTAWMDELPYLASIEYHSAFAKGLGANLLAANIHFPINKFHGSGIYTPNGSVNYYYDEGLFSGGKLLVSDVYSDGYGKKVEFVDMKEEIGIVEMTQHLNHQQQIKAKKQFERYSLKETSILNIPKSALYKELSVSLPKENYTFVPMSAAEGVAHGCRGNVCCEVEFNKSVTASFYVLAAFTGYDDGRYTEICAVLKCPDGTFASCGDVVTTSDTRFNFLKLRGNFTTPDIFPEVLVAKDGTVGLVQGEWVYNGGGEIEAVRGISEPLITASLFARKYSKDKLLTL